MPEQPASPVAAIARLVLDLNYADLRDMARGVREACGIGTSEYHVAECLTAWAQAAAKAVRS